MNCPYCGRINPDDTIFCPSCGTAIHLPTPKKSGSNIAVIVIAVLAVSVVLTIVMAAVMYVMVLGIGGGPPQSIVISMTKSSSATNWIVTVVAIGGTSNLALANLLLIVKDPAGAITLMSSPLITMISGVYYNGVMFQEYSNSGYLRVGDAFVLDRSQYSVGSTIMLTNSAGTSTYGSCTI
jgi:hypothetical protein